MKKPVREHLEIKTWVVLVAVVVVCAAVSLAVGAGTAYVVEDDASSQVQAEQGQRIMDNCHNLSEGRAAIRQVLHAVIDFIAAQPHTPGGDRFILVMQGQLESRRLRALRC